MNEDYIDEQRSLYVEVSKVEVTRGISRDGN